MSKAEEREPAPVLTTVPVSDDDDHVVVPPLPAERNASIVGLLAPGGTPPPPQPRYVADGELGRGGMGMVLSVLDRDLNRVVAKKTTASAQRTSRRFLLEAQVSAQLEHPNILPVYDLDVDEQGRLFFTMKRLEHHATLRDVIDRLARGDVEAQRVYTFERRVQVVQQVCQALAYAHERGVAHRDVKPANILVGPQGEIYLADWGIAGLRGGSGVPRGATGGTDDRPGGRPTSGGFRGTLAYMSPERIHATAPEFDIDGDVYSLCAVMYELLTLRHYVSAGPTNDRDIMFERVRDNRYVDAKHHADPVHGSVPPALSHVCRAGLVERSIRTATQLDEALQRWIEGRAPVVCPRTAIQRVLCAWIRFLDAHIIAGPALTFLVLAIFVVGIIVASLALVR